MQRVGEPLPEAIAAAESARAAFTAAAASGAATKADANTASRHHEPSASDADSHAAGASVNTNEKDEKVSRLVARGPDGTRGFHTTVDGKRWTGVEAWVVSDGICANCLSMLATDSCVHGWSFGVAVPVITSTQCRTRQSQSRNSIQQFLSLSRLLHDAIMSFMISSFVRSI